MDVFWLGLIPTKIDKLIANNINRKEIFNFTPSQSACIAMETDLKEMWEEVKELLMAKAIGLHRIIGFISKNKEKEYREKFHLEKGTHKALKKEKKRKASVSVLTKEEKGKKCKRDQQGNVHQYKSSIDMISMQQKE